MYDIIKNVILSKNFELADMLKKIDTIWLQGTVNDDERTELIGLARDNADTTHSMDTLAKLEDHEKRIRALENAQSGGESGGEEPEEEYPPYVAGKWYYNGDKCSQNGKNYVCTAPDGQICTWSPSEYPAYWEEEA